MWKRLIPGTLLAAAALFLAACEVNEEGEEPQPTPAAQASPAVTVTTDGCRRRVPDGEKVPPNKAVEEFVPYTLPVTPVAGLPLPIDYGRYHFAAPETDPGPYAPFPTPPPGVRKAGHDVKESATLGEFRDHDLFVDPPYIPAGWELLGAHAETVIWDDGSKWDSMFAVAYCRTEYFDIDIKRFLVAPEGKLRLVANPQGDVAYTLSEIRGVPVVYNKDPLQVHFVQGSVATHIEAPLLHLDEMMKIAEGLIAQAQEAAPRTL